MSKFIVPRIVEHYGYVEVFGGSAAVLFSKPKSRLETYNDYNDEIANFFRVLSDKTLSIELKKSLDWALYSRRDFQIAHETLKDPESTPVQKAKATFLSYRLSFSGYATNNKPTFGVSRRSPSGSEPYVTAIQLIEKFHRRLEHVQIECLDWRVILEKYDDPHTFFYLDPPYVQSTRSTKKLYNKEMNEDESHAELIEKISNLKGKVMLSGYENDLYAPLTDFGWEKEIFPTTAHSSGHTDDGERPKRVEVLWMNYTPKQLTFKI